MQIVSGKTECVALRSAPMTTVATPPEPTCMAPAKPGCGAGKVRPHRDRPGERIGEREPVAEADGIHRQEEGERVVPAGKEGEEHADHGKQRDRAAGDDQREDAEALAESPGQEIAEHEPARHQDEVEPVLRAGHAEHVDRDERRAAEEGEEDGRPEGAGERVGPEGRQAREDGEALEEARPFRRRRSRQRGSPAGTGTRSR